MVFFALFFFFVLSITDYRCFPPAQYFRTALWCWLVGIYSLSPQVNVIKRWGQWKCLKPHQTFCLMKYLYGTNKSDAKSLHLIKTPQNRTFSKYDRARFVTSFQTIDHPLVWESLYVPRLIAQKCRISVLFSDSTTGQLKQRKGHIASLNFFWQLL